VDDDGVIACLSGKGCNSHAGLLSASAQSLMATSALQQSLLSFLPIPVDSPTTSDEEDDDDDDAKKPAAMRRSSRDLATQNHRTETNITQGSPTVARARNKGKKHSPRNSTWTRVYIDSEIWYAACEKYMTSGLNLSHKAFLQSSHCNKLLTGSQSHVVSFGKKLKLYNNNELESSKRK